MTIDIRTKDGESLMSTYFAPNSNVHLPLVGDRVLISNSPSRIVVERVFVYLPATPNIPADYIVGLVVD